MTAFSSSTLVCRNPAPPPVEAVAVLRVRVVVVKRRLSEDGFGLRSNSVTEEVIRSPSLTVRNGPYFVANVISTKNEGDRLHVSISGLFPNASLWIAFRCFELDLVYNATLENDTTINAVIPNEVKLEQYVQLFVFFDNQQ